jgi:hypothetical protein
MRAAPIFKAALIGDPFAVWLCGRLRTVISARWCPACAFLPLPCGARNVGVSHSMRMEQSDLVCRDLLLRDRPV